MKITPKFFLKMVNGVPMYISPSVSINQNRIFGGKFHEGNWFYPAMYPYHNNPIEDAKSLFGDIEVVDSTKLLAKLNRYNESVENLELEEGFSFVTTPEQYQKEATVHAVYNYRAAMLLDCGLGKTKVIIDTFRYLDFLYKSKLRTDLINEKPKALVIVKASVLWNWPLEIAKHSNENYKVTVIGGTPAQKKKQLTCCADSDFVIITYEQAAQGAYVQQIKANFAYNIIVADESHKLQTWSSANCKAAYELSQGAGRRIIASGTASLGDPRHLYGQLAFLGDFVVGTSYYNFCDRHLTTSPLNKHIVLGYKNLGALNAQLHKTAKVVKIDDKIKTRRSVVIRETGIANDALEFYTELSRTKCLTGLHDVPLEFPDTIVRINKLHQLANQFVYFSTEDRTTCDGCKHLSNCIDNAIKPYTKQCEVIKVKPKTEIWESKELAKTAVLFSDLEDMLVDPDNAVIVTYRFDNERARIAEQLTAKGIKFIQCTQGTTPKQQVENAELFERDPTYRVYMSQISTLVGINLVRAKYILFHSVSLDLKDYEQARGRNYRLTQKKPEVFEYIYVASGTVEDAIMEALQAKTDVKDLLLNRVDCTSCKDMSRCTKDGTMPWKQNCILKGKTTKQTIKI